ncbi:MAG: hypothetical protein RMA76_08495 [Deltaproteobacteria bacterium]|jgi:hypothetical protein
MSTVERIRSAFDPLADRFGLTHRSQDVGPREVVVRYHNDVVRLRIVAEAGAAPSVMVGAKDGLVFGLGELGAVAEDDDFVALAARTAEYADAILAGDFSSFDRLRRERAARVREDNQARWGTATGETPRFDERPTLEALFSDAHNDGLRTARAYQGHWDYAYALEELATFLGESVADVQRRLDDWDRV